MDDDELTVWCGNLPSDVDEELLYELFLQAAPLKRVRIPTDSKTGRQVNFGFVTFKHDISVNYAISMLNGTKLYDKNIIVRQRNANNQGTPGPKFDNPMSAQVRPQFHNRTEGRNTYESKNAMRNPYNKENKRGENKHYRHDSTHYNNHTSRGEQWGGHNRYNDSNDRYGHNRRRY